MKVGGCRLAADVNHIQRSKHTRLSFSNIEHGQHDCVPTEPHVGTAYSHPKKIEKLWLGLCKFQLLNMCSCELCMQLPRFHVLCSNGDDEVVTGVSLFLCSSSFGCFSNNSLKVEMVMMH